MSHIGHLYLSLLIVFAPFYLKVSACNKEQTNTTIGFRSNALSNRTHIFVLQCCIINKYCMFLSSVAFLNSFTNCQMYLESLPDELIPAICSMCTYDNISCSEKKRNS